ncbi:hypothetical protein BDV28DRAFT_89517 [Aspergillus coremiiformis]|uniref:Uncharacterized protein n=1 Tax=Aspergillus coremiiformis TaxID=138285 RepID=A0A5N6YV21_9EURO|nr:hypothetical protein BDV28DRAFT_89517 [Aspergillus coremiiformis]
MSSRKQFVMFHSPRRHLWTFAIYRPISPLWRQWRLPQKNPSLLCFQVATSNFSSSGGPEKPRYALETYLPNTPHHKTALVLSGASQSLTAYDFHRLLKSEGNSLLGLEEVLPMRRAQTLQRSDSWILVFVSPAYAMECQQRVIELKKLDLRQVAPAGTVASNIPLHASTDNRAKHSTLFNHALASTLHNVSMAAQLSPFDSKLQRAIGAHRGLFQLGSSDNRLFPVKLHLDHLAFPSFNTDYIRQLLKLDGIMRGRKWALPDTDDAVIQLKQTTVSGLSQINLGRTDRHPSTSITKMWRVNFLTAFDAVRFVRAWHQKPLPILGHMPINEANRFVKAECIF